MAAPVPAAPPVTANSPISSKVIAAAIGAGAGGTVTTLILWIIGVTAYHVPNSAASVADAIAAVPLPLSGAVGLVLLLAGAAVPGYIVTDPVRQAGAAVINAATNPGAGPAPVLTGAGTPPDVLDDETADEEGPGAEGAVDEGADAGDGADAELAADDADEPVDESADPDLWGDQPEPEARRDQAAAPPVPGAPPAG